MQLYKKLHSSSVTHLIKNILSFTGYNDLILQQAKFVFYNDPICDMVFDVVTMIYFFFMRTDPSTVVGLDSVLKNIGTAKLGDHSNSFNTMLTIMEGHYKNLRENGRPPDHFGHLVLDALSTGPN